MTGFFSKLLSDRAFTTDRTLWHLALVVLAGITCYATSLSTPFYFDDYKELVNDYGITAAPLGELLLNGGARRFADLTFAANYRLHGTDVLGYHLVNVTIHLLCAVAVYFLCRSIMAALQQTGDNPATAPKADSVPVAVAVLFVCHPVQTQAVTYIIQRYTSLVGLLYICAVLAYVNGRLHQDRDGMGPAALRWFGAGTVAALLGAFTKQSIFSLPLMLAMVELVLFRGRHLKTIIAVTAALAATGLAVFAIPRLLDGTGAADVIAALGHATSEDLFAARHDYFFTQTRVIVTYLRLLVWPVGQRLEYDYPEYSTLLDPVVMASALVHVTLLATAVALLVRSARHTAPHRTDCRLMALGILWFYIALSITSSVFPIPDDIVEHRLYLPSAGMMLTLVVLLRVGAARLRLSAALQRLAFGGICLTLAGATIARNGVWVDEIRFWQNEVRLSPGVGRVHANLGFAYLHHDRPAEALAHLADAIRLDQSLRPVWLELGFILERVGGYEGRFSSGEEYLTEDGSIDYRYYRQFYGTAFNTAGLVNELLGRYDEALFWYHRSLTIDPGADTVWYNYGIAAKHQGDKGRLSTAMTQLRQLNPNLAGQLASGSALD